MNVLEYTILERLCLQISENKKAFMYIKWDFVTPTNVSVTACVCVPLLSKQCYRTHALPEVCALPCTVQGESTYLMVV